MEEKEDPWQVGVVIQSGIEGYQDHSMHISMLVISQHHNLTASACEQKI